MTEWSDSTADDVVARRELDATSETPTIQLVSIVADLEDTDPMELAPLYDRIGDLVSGLFDAPSAAAGAELEFTYEGYRVRVRQDGTATFRPASP